MYSLSLLSFFLVLFVLPLGVLFPFPSGISALFSQGPKRSAGLARLYALWNLMSLVNVVSSAKLYLFQTIFNVTQDIIELFSLPAY